MKWNSSPTTTFNYIKKKKKLRELGLLFLCDQNESKMMVCFCYFILRKIWLLVVIVDENEDWGFWKKMLISNNTKRKEQKKDANT